MMSAIAIDDEPMALEVTRSFAVKTGFLDIKGYYTNCFHAVDFMRNNPVDLIFLDIRMPDISGIDLLKTIPDPPMVIFTTAYSEHAVEGFDLNAVDYLLKPFSLPRFLKACNKAYDQWRIRNNQSVKDDPSSVFIRSGYEQIRVDLSDIFYVESNGNYVDFVLHNKKIISRLTMNEAEALLPASSFLRVHRSFIIAKKHISKTGRKTVWIGQTEIPVGGDFAGMIDKILKQ